MKVPPGVGYQYFLESPIIAVRLFYKYLLYQYFLTLGRCTVNTVEKYNPASDTWCEVSPMLTPCRGLGAAILEGILYVVGGSDGIAALNQVGSLVSGMGTCLCMWHCPLTPCLQG